MLTSVPVAINRSARVVTLRHPNSFSCVVSRKRVKRIEPDPGSGDPSEMGGAPTMGGMGVLRSEDEADFEYVLLGDAKMMFAGPGPYQPRDAVDANSALVPETLREVTIESVIDPEKEGGFVADSGDLIMVTLGAGVVVAYDVATVSGTVHVAPYTRRYILNPRDDLNYIEPFAD